jgi:hypothetical protein
MKTILITTIFNFIFCAGILAQNPTIPDSLVKKQTSHPDSVPPAAQQVQQVQQNQPAQAPQQIAEQQPREKKPRKDTRPLSQRIDFDINTSFWANTNQVFSEFMVLVSYRFPKILSIGAGPTYILNYDRKADVNLNGWGGKLFVRAQLLRFFYVWTEYQGISNQYIAAYDPIVKEKDYVDSWFFGAGLNIRMGRRSGINFSVLYDVLHGSSSPYYSPVIYRVGFGF